MANKRKAKSPRRQGPIDRRGYGGGLPRGEKRRHNQGRRRTGTLWLGL